MENKYIAIQKYHAKVKFLLLGEQLVGKTSILHRFTKDEFQNTLVATMGVDYKEKVIDIQNQENKKCLIQVWDTAGQDRFQTITPIYYNKVDGVLLIFDITDSDSFDKIQQWITTLEENTDDCKKLVIVLVGNKSDLKEKRKISLEQGNILAQQKQMQYFETSAKNSTNVQEVFNFIVQELITRRGEQFFLNESTIIQNQLQKSNKQKKSCCC